jgi:hypothetical protein
MKEQSDKITQLKQNVLDKISEYDGEIIYKDSSIIKIEFPKQKIQQAVRTYFEVTENLNQKAELYGGNRLKIFLK